MRSEVFVGRDVELAAVRDLVRDAAAGRGRALMVQGEPGIGKSSLLEVALAGAPRLGCTVLRGAGDELSQRFPLRAMLDVLEIESRSADPRRAEIAALLRGESPTGSGSDVVAAVTERLLALVERLCAESPLVLILDDLHCVDDASLRVWRRLVRVTEQAPLLLVGASRPVPQREELEQACRDVIGRGGSVQTLRPLAAAEVAGLISALLGEPGARLRRLVDQAAGNPLWLREVLDALVREEAVTVHKGVVDLTATAEYPVPASLLAAVSRRLTFLCAETTDVVRAAALLGHEFSVLDLSVVLAKEPSGLIGALAEATRAGVLAEAGDRLRFRHPLIRRALYDGMPAAVRSGLHRHAAQALAEAAAPVQTVADQLAGGGVDPGMLGWLTTAAPELRSRSPVVASELLRRGIEHLAAGDPRWEQLTCELAQALAHVGNVDEAEEPTRQVLACTTDPDRAAQMRDLLIDILYDRSRLAEGTEVAREGLLEPQLPSRWRARLLSQLAFMLVSAGNLDDGEVTATEALAAGTDAGDRHGTGSALYRLSGIRTFRNDSGGALDYADRGLAVVGDDPECARIRLGLLYNRVFVLHTFDRMAEAEESLHAVRPLAERTGGATLARLYTLSAVHCFLAGRWDDALAEIDALSDAPLPALALLWRGLAALIAGHRDERSAADAALKAVDDIEIVTAQHRNHSDFLLRARALAAERDGQSDRAVAILATALEPEYAVMDNRYQLLPALVRLALAVGDTATALAAERTCAADAGAGSTPGRTAAAGHCRGLIEADPAPLLAAAAHYRAAGCPVDLSHTLGDAAVLLAERGRDDDARLAFEEATRLYTALGAVWDLRRADARLRRHGIRRGVRGPRRRPSHGWGALSPTELTVTRLVALGMSNPDIAAELLLSRRTVQSHVSHILTKLDVRSRVEIARLEAERRSPSP